MTDAVTGLRVEQAHDCSAEVTERLTTGPQARLAGNLEKLGHSMACATTHPREVRDACLARTAFRA